MAETRGGGRAGRPGHGAPGGRLLLVDDDAVDRTAVRRHLLRGGFAGTVGEASGVLEAIDMLTAEPYDWVVLDFNLPDGDGLTFLRGMRLAGLSLPVIMLTGQTDPDVMAELMGAGAADYIPKDALTGERLLASLRAAGAR